MQPPPEPTPTAPRGDEDELYRRYRSELHHAVAHAATAPCEVIEDACQNAWTILLRAQPERYAIFGWLRVVAIHETYRLLAIERRETTLKTLGPQNLGGHHGPVDWRSLDDTMEALDALRALASLPARQRNDLTLNLAGYSYKEICARTSGRTMTNVTKSLGKARACLRQPRL